MVTRFKIIIFLLNGLWGEDNIRFKYIFGIYSAMDLFGNIIGERELYIYYLFDICFRIDLFVIRLVP